MRIVALEEHYTVPRIVAGISPDAIARRGFPGPDFVWAQTTRRNELADLGAYPAPPFPTANEIKR